jgi:hypothetical protein
VAVLGGFGLAEKDEDVPELKYQGWQQYKSQDVQYYTNSKKNVFFYYKIQEVHKNYKKKFKK